MRGARMSMTIEVVERAGPPSVTTYIGSNICRLLITPVMMTNQRAGWMFGRVMYQKIDSAPARASANSAP